jgi:hypothetical protein
LSQEARGQVDSVDIKDLKDDTRLIKKLKPAGLVILEIKEINENFTARRIQLFLEIGYYENFTFR